MHLNQASASRRSSLTVFGLAVAATGLAASVLAPVTDTIRSQDNNLASPPGTAPGQIDLRAATVDSGQGCESLLDADYSDDATVPAIFDSAGGGALIDPEQRGVEVLNSSTLCLRNFGDADGDLVLDVSAATSTEVGACDANEVASGDTTCADGDPGELPDLLTLFTSATCEGDGFAPGPVELLAGGTQSIAVVSAGEVCEFFFFVEPSIDDPLIEQQQAATDTAVWDMSFTLDVVA